MLLLVLSWLFDVVVVGFGTRFYFMTPPTTTQARPRKEELFGRKKELLTRSFFSRLPALCQVLAVLPLLIDSMTVCDCELDREFSRDRFDSENR